MGLSRYSNIEGLIRNTNFNIGIDHLIQHYGQEVEVYQPSIDTFSDVYGTASGKTDYNFKEIIEVLATGDSFFPADSLSSGTFVEGYIYVQAKDFKVIHAGCMISVKTRDNKKRKYKVEFKEDIGVMTSMFERYRVSALL